jgi:hypothetical protein
MLRFGDIVNDSVDNAVRLFVLRCKKVTAGAWLSVVILLLFLGPVAFDCEIGKQFGQHK